MKTSIQISNDVWEKLNKMKKVRGETFEDVLKKLLNMEVKESGNKKRGT